MKFTEAPDIDTYRIGGPRRMPHWRHRFHVDLFFRSWQAEWVDCWWAPRAWTKVGVRRKAFRWRRRHTDIRKHERRYGANTQAHAIRAAGSDS